MDIIELFEDYDIEYWTEGKNVSSGWVNIQCIFCQDDSNHLGIRKKDLKISCWRCGNHDMINFITGITELSRSEAFLISKRLSLGATDTYPPAESSASSLLSAQVRLPQESRKYFPEKHLEYLKNRGFQDPEKIIRKYKLQAVHTIGKYKFRIIIPIILNRKILSFTSRDITEFQEPKYKHASANESAMDIKKLVYNIDTLTIGSDAILVEGPVDVWKLGKGAISFLGVNNTEEQVIVLKNKKIRNLFILFDNDRAGKREAKRIAKILSPLVKETEIVTFKNINDPGELRTEEVAILRNQLGV